MGIYLHMELTGLWNRLDLGMPGYKGSSDVIYVLLFSLIGFLHLVVMRATRSSRLTCYQLSKLGRKRASSLISLAEKSQRRFWLAMSSFLNQLLWPWEWNILTGHVSTMVRGGRSATPKLFRSGSLLEKGLVTGRRQDECWEGKSNSCSL